MLPSNETAIPDLNINLDGYSEIVTHPDNIETIKKAINKYQVKKDNFIFHHAGIKITANEHMAKKIHAKKNGKLLWKRGSVLPDTKFIEWINLEEEEPTSWQIYFGLVEPVMEMNMVLIRPMFFNSKYDTPIINDRRIFFRTQT